MAAGLTLPRENVEEFRRRLNEQTTLTEEDFIPKVVIDVPMPISYLTEERIKELDILEPFGKGNTKPLFAEKGLDVLCMRLLGKNRNVLKLLVRNRDGIMMDALYFGDVSLMVEYMREKFGTLEVEKCFQNRENRITMSVVYYPSVNEYRNRRSIQIVISHYQ